MASMDTSEGPGGGRGGYRGGYRGGGGRRGGGYHQGGRSDRYDSSYENRGGGYHDNRGGYQDNRGGYQDNRQMYQEDRRGGYQGGGGGGGGRRGGGWYDQRDYDDYNARGKAGRYNNNYDQGGRSSGGGGGGGGYRGRGGRGGRQNWGGGRQNQQRPSTPEQLPDDIALVTELVAHENKVSVIHFDAASQQLYTGGQDRHVKVWSCSTGQCTNTVDVGGEVDSLLIEGGFLIVGLHDGKEGLIKIWNMATGHQHMLSGHQGEVLCLASGNNALLSGGQDCSVRVWSFNAQAQIFSLSAIWSKSQGGHTMPVASMAVQGKYLFTGDFSGLLKVWDLVEGRNLQTFQVHDKCVTKLLMWQTFVLTGSLDGSVKVWAPQAESAIGLGTVLQVEPSHVFQDQDEAKRRQGGPPRGVLQMHGTVDKAGTEMLMVAYQGISGVKLYELPSLNCRGMLPSGGDARSVTSVPGMLLITGSVNGKVKVFQWK